MQRLPQHGNDSLFALFHTPRLWNGRDAPAGQLSSMTGVDPPLDPAKTVAASTGKVGELFVGRTGGIAGCVCGSRASIDSEFSGGVTIPAGSRMCLCQQIHPSLVVVNDQVGDELMGREGSWDGGLWRWGELQGISDDGNRVADAVGLDAEDRRDTAVREEVADFHQFLR